MGEIDNSVYLRIRSSLVALPLLYMRLIAEYVCSFRREVSKLNARGYGVFRSKKSRSRATAAYT